MGDSREEIRDTLMSACYVAASFLLLVVLSSTASSYKPRL